MSFNRDDDRFLELTDRPGIITAPYLVGAIWVYVNREVDLSDQKRRSCCVDRLNAQS